MSFNRLPELGKRFTAMVLMFALILALLSSIPQTARATSTTDADGYIIVTNAAELDAIRSDITAKYRLYADISLAGYVSATNTAAKGWYPIGYGLQHFSGELDGNGHTISGLWSSGSWGISYKGLFSVTIGATIKNLNIELASAGITGGYEVGAVTGDARNGTLIENVTVNGGQIIVTGGGYAGGLVGHAYGSPAVVVRDCTVNGTYTRTSGNYSGGLIGVATNGTQIIRCKTVDTVSEGTSYVGGIAGAVHGGTVLESVYSNGSAEANISYAGGLAGAVYGQSSISGGYAAGNVNAAYYAGGLVGTLYESSEIFKSCAYGSVTTTNYIAGGLVGEAVASTISNSYARGNVIGTTGVGGLVGYFSGLGTSNTKSVENSYSSGSVTGVGTAEYGAFNGRSGVKYLGTNYYDGDTADAPGAYGTGGSPAGTASSYPQSRTTVLMMKQSTFVGWDFGNIWDIDEDETYPYFSPFFETDSPEIDYELDSDGDGLPDYIEELLGTDPFNADTDGDGLTDYEEFVLVGSDPSAPDSDADADGDGLSNYDELHVYGTNPANPDTDGDGLNDYEEIFVYETDPLDRDTDGDGASDGWEVEHGYDPVAFESSFEVVKTITEDSGFTVSVEMDLSGEQVETVSVVDATDGTFFDTDIPGYIAAPYSIEVDGEFGTATISFEFDTALLLDPDFEPQIYWWNEEEQFLEEVPTTVAGNVASAVVTHFSIYILLDKRGYYEAVLGSLSGGLVTQPLEVCFAFSASNSMAVSDPGKLGVTAAKNLTYELRPGDRVVTTWSGAYSFLPGAIDDPITEDMEVARARLDAVTSDQGGSNIALAILHGISHLSNGLPDSRKILIVLADTPDPYPYLSIGNQLYPYFTQIIPNAKTLGISIYTIGLGASFNVYNNAVVQYQAAAAQTNVLATHSNPKGYYHANNAGELTAIYEEILSEIMTDEFSDLDTDGDGLTDNIEQAVNLGKIRLGTGRMITGVTGNEYLSVIDPDNNDTDGDGLLDGEELVISTRTVTANGVTKDVVYATLWSNPLIGDSDYDGIDDGPDDENPLAISGGNRFKGKLQLETHADEHNYRYANVEFSVNYKLFFWGNTTYIKDLSVLGSLLSSVVYKNDKLDVTSGTNVIANINGSNGAAEMLKTFGARETVDYKLEDDYNDDDLSEVVLGHRKVVFEGQTKEIIFAVVRGTNGTIEEWSSNFDVGAKNVVNGTYWDENNPEWLTPSHHKGFDVAANRIYGAIIDYADDYIDPGVDKVIFITGHSRGGAIANLLGAKFEDDPNYKSFTYTFAAPNTVAPGGSAIVPTSYNTIFNIVNDDDMVPMMPLEAWGFAKYGTTKHVSVEKELEAHIYITEPAWSFEGLTGKDYNPNGITRGWAMRAFEDLASTRNDLYVYQNLTDTEYLIALGLNWDEAYEIKTYTESEYGVRIARYANVVMLQDQDVGGYSVISKQTVAFLMAALADVAAGEEHGGGRSGSPLGFAVAWRYEWPRTAFILAAADNAPGGVGIFTRTAKIGGMGHPHWQETYYLIARQVNFSIN